MSNDGNTLQLTTKSGEISKISKSAAELSDFLNDILQDSSKSSNVILIPNVNHVSVQRVVKWMEHWKLRPINEYEFAGWFKDNPFNKELLEPLTQQDLRDLVKD
jgi:hypothetical protein